MLQNKGSTNKTKECMFLYAQLSEEKCMLGLPGRVKVCLFARPMCVRHAVLPSFSLKFSPSFSFSANGRVR